MTMMNNGAIAKIVVNDSAAASRGALSAFHRANVSLTIPTSRCSAIPGLSYPRCANPSAGGYAMETLAEREQETDSHGGAQRGGHGQRPRPPSLRTLLALQRLPEVHDVRERGHVPRRRAQPLGGRRRRQARVGCGERRLDPRPADRL